MRYDNLQRIGPNIWSSLKSQWQIMVAITAFSTLLPVHLHAQITSTNTSPAVSGGTGTTVNENATIVIGSGGNGTVTVDGAGTTLNAIENGVVPTEDGRIIVGGDAGTGDLNILNGGTVNITADGVGSGDSQLFISNGSFGASQLGTVTLNSGTLNLSSENESSLLGIGRRGQGIVNATNSTISISSASAVEGTVLHLGGSGTLVSDIGTFGEMTLTNTSLTLNSTNAASFGGNSISVGRNTDGSILEGSRPMNTLIVQSGSTISMNQANAAATNSLTVGRENSRGTLTVTGSGSAINDLDFFNVGRDGGIGTATIENSGVVNATRGFASTRVGRDGGSGTLNVETGGTLNTEVLEIGRGSGSGSGTVNLNGTGSTINANDTVHVGRVTGYSGTLNIGDNPSTGGVENGGTLNSHTVTVGTDAGSLGTMNINGSTANVSLTGLDAGGNGAVMLVGRIGTGTANVTNGATVNIDAGAVPTGLNGGMLIGGSGTDPATTGFGTLNVDGAGSSITLADDNARSQIGRQGSGVMNITNGATVTMTNGTGETFSVVGRKSTGSGSVTVDGAGSTWSAGQNLFIGTDVDFGVAGGAALGGGGTGIVQVSNGGVINVGAGGTVHVDSGGALVGNGTVNGNVLAVNGGAVSAGLSPGTMTINGDLNIDTGTLVAEVLGGSADLYDVSGSVTIGSNASIHFIFDTLDPQALGSLMVDLDGFFQTPGPINYGALTASNFTVFVTDAGLVGNNYQIDYGGTVVSVTSELLVPEPGMVLIFGLGVVGLIWRRRHRRSN